MSVGQEQDDHLKMFVGGLSWATDDKSLGEYFSKFGTVTQAEIKKEKFPPFNPRGFGFVTFEDYSSIERVMQQEKHTLDGKDIDPKPATAKNATPGHPYQQQPSHASQSEDPKKVFVGGIPPLGPGIETMEKLEAELMSTLKARTGPDSVSKVEIKYDANTGRHKGFGFALFTTEEAAKVVCADQYLTVQGKRVEFKKADPRHRGRGGGRGGHTGQPYYNMGGQQWSGEPYAGGSYSAYGTGGAGSGYNHQQYGMYQGYNQHQAYPQQQQTAHHGSSAAQLGSYDQYYGSAAQAQGDSTAGSYGQGYASYGGSYGSHQGSHPGYAGQPQQQPHQQQYYGHHPAR